MIRAPILLTGGAGYIGSHTALALLENGWPVVVVDNLSCGQRRLVPDGATFIEADIADRAAMAAIIRAHGCRHLMHFAGSIVVSESMSDPAKYYDNNLAASIALIATCAEAGIRSMVFSSTAAVYGVPALVPVPEESPLAPINPYGRTKLATEWMLEDMARAHGVEVAVLRYFNVAGADPQLRTGEVAPVATHLIKIAAQTAAGLRPGMAIHGDDYPTPDGTCVRDYIHVSDLAAAHVAALNRMAGGGGGMIANCGYGRGHSVREVIAVMKQVTATDFPVALAARRPGDPPVLVADCTRIRDTLDWQPRHDDLALICRTAYEWELRNKARP